MQSLESPDGELEASLPPLLGPCVEESPQQSAAAAATAEPEDLETRDPSLSQVDMRSQPRDQQAWAIHAGACGSNDDELEQPAAQAAYFGLGDIKDDGEGFPYELEENTGIARGERAPAGLAGELDSASGHAGREEHIERGEAAQTTQADHPQGEATLPRFIVERDAGTGHGLAGNTESEGVEIRAASCLTDTEWPARAPEHQACVSDAGGIVSNETGKDVEGGHHPGYCHGENAGGDEKLWASLSPSVITDVEDTTSMTVQRTVAGTAEQSDMTAHIEEEEQHGHE